MNDLNLKSKLLDTAIFLAGFTGLIYLAAASEQFGEFKFYQVSFKEDLSIITLVSICYEIILQLFLFAIVVFIAYCLINKLETFSKHSNSYNLCFALAHYSTAITGICYFRLNHEFNLLPTIYLTLLVVTIFFFAFYLFLAKKKKNYFLNNKIIDSQSTEYFSEFGVFFQAFFVVISFSMLYGFDKSSNRDRYFILSDSPNTVLINKIHDEYICKKFDVKTKRISDTTIILKADQKAPIILVSKQIRLYKNLKEDSWDLIK